jgi:hypothetical protein
VVGVGRRATGVFEEVETDVEVVLVRGAKPRVMAQERAETKTTKMRNDMAYLFILRLLGKG